MTFHPDSGGALQRVQVRAGAAAVHRDQAYCQEVCGAGLHPGTGFLRHLIFGRFSTNYTKNIFRRARRQSLTRSCCPSAGT